jgi:hypothetical protein
VVLCSDSITRRFYPRIFTYSADYPEKYVNLYLTMNAIDLDFIRVLIATVRNLGGCPCPRCLIPKERIQNMGRPQDRKQRETLARNNEKRRNMVSTARSLIYDRNYAVGSAPVEHILKPQSWVPTSVKPELSSLTIANHSIECLPRSPWSFGFRHFQCARSRSFARVRDRCLEDAFYSFVTDPYRAGQGSYP